MSDPKAPERRLGALGALVWDTIHPWPPGAPPRQTWGGIAHALRALSAALQPPWRLVPLAWVGPERAAEAAHLLRGLPACAPGAAFAPSPLPTNQVTLRYYSPDERHESQLALIPPWTPEDLLPRVAALDALYINFLSGLELELPTLETLRAAFPGFIYADLHSLTLTRERPDLPRALRLPPDALRWLACFDAVQANAAEAALFEPLGGLPHLQAALPPPRLLAITRGAQGATRYPRDAPNQPWRLLRAAPPQVVLCDPTGCGDTFGATLCAHLLASTPLEDALRVAQEAAAAKAATPPAA